MKIKSKKNGEVRICNDTKLSRDEKEFISYVAEISDESWYDVLDYIETHHMISRLRNYDETLAQEIRGGLLMESVGM